MFANCRSLASNASTLLGAFWRFWRRRRRNEEGTSAVEFALLAPVLALGLVASADLGLAVYHKMSIDQALRAGAQTAIADPGAAAVLKTTQNTISKHFTVLSSSTPTVDGVSVSVSRFCACPEKPAMEVVCSTPCVGDAPTFIYYLLAGGTIYQGMLLPAITLHPTVKVQIR